MPIKEKSSFMPEARRKAQAAAQAVAVSALGFLAQDMERISGFLAATGLGPADLREAAHRPQFGAGVLAFLLADEGLLLTFCAEAELRPQDVERAHAVLDPPFDPDRALQRE